MTTGWRIEEVDRIDCDLGAQSWSFATEQADAIDRHWAERTRQTPELFNGRVLMLAQGAVGDESGGRVLRGRFTPLDFKAFLAWREFGSAVTELRNCFSMAAIETSDGAFVLGEMAPHTAPAGQIYFPSGTPDLHDVVAGRVDIEGSARRELREETGLLETDPTVRFLPGFILVTDERRVCCMKRVAVAEPAEAVVERIHRFLAKDPKPELSRMHIVRQGSDIGPAVPDFVASYILSRLALRG